MIEKVKAAPACWKSSITAKSIFQSKRTISNLLPWKEGLLFLITEPEERNANLLMYSDVNGQTKRISPEGINVRSKVHEYGGRAFTASADEVYYCNFQDQEIYKQTLKDGTGIISDPVAITCSQGDNVRYVDLTFDSKRNRLIAVREDHRKTGCETDEAVNSLVAMPVMPTDSPIEADDQEILFSDYDFVSSPSLSKDGNYLVFVAWLHPNMPWDKTEIVVARLNENGSISKIGTIDLDNESAKTQPGFGPENEIYFLCDQSNFWNLRKCSLETSSKEWVSSVVYPVEADCCGPSWITGRKNYAFCSQNKMVISSLKDCWWKLHYVDLDSKSSKILHAEIGMLEDVTASEDHIFYLAASDTDYPAVFAYSHAYDDAHDHGLKPDLRPPQPIIRTKIPSNFSRSTISKPDHFHFKSADNETAYGLYYAPGNPGFDLPDNKAPPLLINVHGGPTGTAQAALNPMHQFWTSRGFAVLDLNHRGSSGYGRKFRKQLYGKWGLADVQDVIYAIKYLVQSKLAEPGQIAIRGGSAGGYLVLACLAESNLLAAGVSYYGIADLELLTRDTHKFESRYLDQLIGPYPECRNLYRDRSPINKLGNIKAPVLIFQGRLDKVVPANQAEALFEKLFQTNPKTEIVYFENEGHGFRTPDNQIEALNRELRFYETNLLDQGNH